MAHLETSSFSLLVHDGENYLIWAFNIKLHLHARNIVKKIQKPFLEISIDPYDAQALLFM